MIPGSFDYHRPTSLDGAVALMASLEGDRLLVAGGHSLIPMMKLRMAAPEHLIDLQDVGELKALDISGGQVTIGAMVTQHALIASAELAAVCPIIREASLQIADPQVRYMGTLGGNVANGDPGNDLPAVMQALDATYMLRGAHGEREVTARDFYQAAYFTSRKEDEILTRVCFAAPPSGHGACYMKQKRKIGDYATAAAAVIVSMSGGTCQSASIALTNLGDTPLFAEAAATAVVGTPVDAAAIAAAVTAAKAICRPASDGRGPAEFRTHVAGVMVRRALETAAARTG